MDANIQEITSLLKTMDSPIQSNVVEQLTKLSENRNKFLLWLLDMSQIYCPIEDKLLQTEKLSSIKKIKRRSHSKNESINPEIKELSKILLFYGFCSSEEESLEILSAKSLPEDQLSIFLHLLRLLNLCKSRVVPTSEWVEPSSVVDHSEYSTPQSDQNVKKELPSIRKIGQRSRLEYNPLIAGKPTSFLPADISRELANDIASYTKESDYARFIEQRKLSRNDHLSRTKEELTRINENIDKSRDFTNEYVNQSHLERLKVTVDELNQLIDSFSFACGSDFTPLISKSNDSDTNSNPTIQLNNLGPSAKRLDAQMGGIIDYFSLLESLHNQVAKIQTLCQSLSIDSYPLICESVTALCNEINDLVIS